MHTTRFCRNSGFPHIFLILALISSVFGLILIRSAAAAMQGDFMRNQIIALVIGAGLYFAAYYIDPCRYSRLWIPVCVLNFLFIASLYFFGAGYSNKSWLRAGSIGIQPAEIGKLVFIFTFSAHIERAKRSNFRFYDIMALAFHASVMISAVILFSRDDGMSLAFVFIALYMLYTAGLPEKYFIFGGAALAAASPLIWQKFMDEYQRSRILAVFHPEDYPDIAYQALHSRSAVSSGGLLGMGYMNGTLTQHNLLPTKHTDSIIAVAGEELGFAGCAGIILLLTVFIILCIRTSLRTDDGISRSICTGISGMFIFQTILNIGMNLGLLPMIGLTLPFFSCGGSSLVTMFIAAGLAAGADRRSIKEKYNNIYGGTHEKSYRYDRIQRGLPQNH